MTPKSSFGMDVMSTDETVLSSVHARPRTASWSPNLLRFLGCHVVGSHEQCRTQSPGANRDGHHGPHRNLCPRHNHSDTSGGYWRSTGRGDDQSASNCDHLITDVFAEHFPNGSPDASTDSSTNSIREDLSSIDMPMIINGLFDHATSCRPDPASQCTRPDHGNH
jgi:hypothetical protein